MPNRVFIPLSLPEPVPVAVSAEIQSLSGLTMGTSWSVRLICPEGQTAAILYEGIRHRLDLVVAQMSTWRSDSDLGRYNGSEAGSWHVMSGHFFRVLDCALAIAEESDGAYDPSVGPLVNLWGFGPDPVQQSAPHPAALEQARARCGWKRLRIDRERKALLQPGGLYLDFSSIAKGYGVDLVAQYLQGMGVPSYLAEVGGELRGTGVKPDGQPWWVGLEQPPAPNRVNSIADSKAGSSAGHLQSIVALHGVALATSGDYRRYVEHAGQRYSHTIDPRTARPIAHRLASVTVLHADCMTADAWATALMVLGQEEGLQLATRAGLAALFTGRIDADKFHESMTPAMQAMLA